MTRKLLLVTAIATAASLLSCSGDLADPAIVNSPRIIAMRCLPPEVQPGETVTVEALTAFVPPGSVYTWSLCQVNLLLGAASCNQPQYLTTLGTGSSITMTVPTDALQGIPPAGQLQGISVYVALDIQSPPGTVGLVRPTGIRVVTVSTNPSPHVNPTIDRVLINGSESPGLLTPPSDVILEGDAGPAQVYIDPSTGVTVTETLSFHWFVSDGNIDSDSTEPNLTTGKASTIWHYAGTAPPQEWVVLNDSRGGVDWWVP